MIETRNAPASHSNEDLTVIIRLIEPNLKALPSTYSLP